MTNLEEKIKTVFRDAAVLKTNEIKALFAASSLPSFLRDFISRRYMDSEGNVDNLRISDFLGKYLPPKDSDIKMRLLKAAGETIPLLTRFAVESDLANGIIRFSIPDRGIKASEGIIPSYIVNQVPDLDGGEHWGTVKLLYIQPCGKEKGHIEIVDYRPFKPYKQSLETYKAQRREFSFNEWIDVLLRAMEYNETSFESLNQKLIFLSRLLIFCERNLNMIELAPKGTGKSYVFGNLSKHGWMISGGKVTRAKLIFDMQKRTNGAIARYDFVTMDEIQTINFSDSSELQAALKTYLEQGWTTVGNNRIEGDAGLMIMGNIPLGQDRLPKDRRYFHTLPDFFKESALLDRFHGFIEGWFLPRIRENMLISGWTVNAEYFTEMLSLLRGQSEYAQICDELIDRAPYADTRDTKAIKRLCSAYLKLFFPHITSSGEISKEDFKRYCFEPALRMRGIIREQISFIDPEYRPDIQGITVR